MLLDFLQITLINIKNGVFYLTEVQPTKSEFFWETKNCDKCFEGKEKILKKMGKTYPLAK